MTRNQLTYWANKEAARHNRATERHDQDTLAESVRHNLVSETTNERQAQASLQRSEAAMKTANIQEALLPYQKAESVSRTAKNYTGAASDIMKTATSIASASAGIPSFAT